MLLLLCPYKIICKANIQHIAYFFLEMHLITRKRRILHLQLWGGIHKSNLIFIYLLLVCFFLPLLHFAPLFLFLPALLRSNTQIEIIYVYSYYSLIFLHTTFWLNGIITFIVIHSHIRLYFISFYLFYFSKTWPETVIQISTGLSIPHMETSGISHQVWPTTKRSKVLL